MPEGNLALSRVTTRFCLPSCHRPAAPGCPPSAPLAPDERLSVLPRFISARSLPCTDHSDRPRPLLRIGAAAATAAVITGVTVAASAGTALAAPTRTSAPATPAADPRPGIPAAGAPVLQAPALRGTAPLAAPSLDDTALGTSAPLANPAASTTSPGSPFAHTGPPPAPPHRQAARPAARPSASPDTQPSATASPSSTPSASPSAGPSKPYAFYDSVEPQTVPAGAIVGTYSTGAHPIAASTVAGRKQVLWIDTLATDPQGSGALDVEPGCATPSQVPGWVSSRLKAHPGQIAIVYMSLSEWPQVKADVASLPAWMQSRIRWWVADPTGVPHIVPGSQATQWYWGSTYDESMAAPNFDPTLVAGPSTG
jgi:hypothetical protein